MWHELMELKEENGSVIFASQVRSSICKDQGVEQNNLKLFSINIESTVTEVYYAIFFCDYFKKLF
jgi:hypothetical protein